MKVRELIARLKHQDPDAEVMMSYTANDHWDTARAIDIGYVEQTGVTDNGNGGWELGVCDNETADEREAVVLR